MKSTRPGFGRVLAGIYIHNATQASLLLRAVERELREGQNEMNDEAKLRDWRAELINLRRRAVLKGWTGWIEDDRR